MEDTGVIRGRRLTDAESWRLIYPDPEWLPDEWFQEVIEPLLNKTKEDFYE